MEEAIPRVTNLLTVEEAAGKMGVTKMTVYNWINDKKIYPVMAGNYQFIPTEEVDRILAQKEARRAGCNP